MASLTPASMGLASAALNVSSRTYSSTSCGDRLPASGMASLMARKIAGFRDRAQMMRVARHLHLAAVAKNASGESLAQARSRPGHARPILPEGLQKNAWKKAVFEPSARPFVEPGQSGNDGSWSTHACRGTSKVPSEGLPATAVRCPVRWSPAARSLVLASCRGRPLRCASRPASSCRRWGKRPRNLRFCVPLKAKPDKEKEVVW